RCFNCFWCFFDFSRRRLHSRGWGGNMRGFRGGLVALHLCGLWRRLLGRGRFRLLVRRGGGLLARDRRTLFPVDRALTDNHFPRDRACAVDSRRFFFEIFFLKLVLVRGEILVEGDGIESSVLYGIKLELLGGL